MASIFKITDDYFALKNLIDETMVDEDGNARAIDDTTGKILSDMTDELKHNFETKAENYGRLIKENDNKADFIAMEIKRLQALKKTYEVKNFGLKYMLETSMKWIQTKKIKSETFTFSIQKNPPSLVINDASKIPVEFKFVAEAQILND